MAKKDHPAVGLFKELLQIPAPSGREERMSAFIEKKIKALGFRCRVDAGGNVIVRLSGKKPRAGKVILAAHMDEIGMVVTKIQSDGSLCVGPSGGLLPWKIGECPVDIVADEEIVTGVLSMGSTHCRGAADKKVTWDDVKIITGLSVEELGAAGVRPGSTAVPAGDVRGPVLLGRGDDPLIGAWTFDDRMGVVALLRMLKTIKQKKLKPIHPTLVCFTVHEEGGCHGAKVLAQREKPDLFIAVDGCPVQDSDVLKLDGRAGVWSKDSHIHSDQQVVTALCQAARKAGTELQVVVYDAAGSDASAAYSCGGAARAVTIGHVRDNSHGYEVARLSCFDNLLKTLVQFITTWE